MTMFLQVAGAIGSGHTLTFGGQVLNYVQSHVLDEGGKFRIMWNVAARRRELLQVCTAALCVMLMMLKMILTRFQSGD
jgi:hypothetical protein